jgi:hypothetical protein
MRHPADQIGAAVLQAYLDRFNAWNCADDLLHRGHAVSAAHATDGQTVLPQVSGVLGVFLALLTHMSILNRWKENRSPMKGYTNHASKAFSTSALTGEIKRHL